jgi:hypothetical protein
MVSRGTDGHTMKVLRDYWVARESLLPLQQLAYVSPQNQALRSEDRRSKLQSCGDEQIGCDGLEAESKRCWTLRRENLRRR